MSESLTPPHEGEPPSPLQRVASHIDSVIANQPVDPDTGLQIAKRHITGHADKTVIYERNSVSGECRVTVDIPPYQQWHLPLPLIKPPEPRPGIYQKFIFTPDQQIIDPKARLQGEPTSPGFQVRIIELLLGLEPTLTERPLSAFGRVLLQLRTSKK